MQDTVADTESFGAALKRAIFGTVWAPLGICLPTAIFGILMTNYVAHPFEVSHAIMMLYVVLVVKRGCAHTSAAPLPN